MTVTDDPWAAESAPSSTDEAPSAASEPEGGAEAPKPEAKTTKTAKKTAAAKPAPEPKAEPQPEPAAEDEPGATLGDMTTFVTVLYYGPEGTGKTTDALRMTKLDEKKKVFLIDAEAGAKIVALRQRGVDVSRIRVWPRPEDGGPAALTFEGLYDIAGWLADHADEYIGWVWDSGTEITKRLLDQVTAEARARDQALGKRRGRFQTNLEDHGVASAMLRELLRRFRDIPMHGVITALERRDVDEDTGRVRYGPAMSPAMANDSAGLVDVVAYKTVDMVGESQTEVRSGTFVPTAIRRAKDRFGVLPGKLADPYFDRIVAYVEGELTRDTDEVQARVRELAGAAPAAATDNKEN